MTSVLIVDDSKTARLVMSHWLTKKLPGIIILEASNSREALHVLEQTNKKVYVVVDYNMPDENGLELIQKISSIVSTSHIALCTANIQVAVRERAAKMGILYIAKPMTADKVETILKNLGVI